MTHYLQSDSIHQSDAIYLTNAPTILTEKLSYHAAELILCAESTNGEKQSES